MSIIEHILFFFDVCRQYLETIYPIYFLEEEEDD